MNETIKSEMIKYRVQRADETIEEVNSHILNSYLHTAVNRIYYGIFYIVSALALKFNFQTKNHGQLMGWFNREFIKTKIIPEKFSKIYRWAFNNRQSGDYDDFITFTKEEIEIQFGEMKEFIQEIKVKLSIE